MALTPLRITFLFLASVRYAFIFLLRHGSQPVFSRQAPLYTRKQRSVVRSLRLGGFLSGEKSEKPRVIVLGKIRFNRIISPAAVLQHTENTRLPLLLGRRFYKERKRSRWLCRRRRYSTPKKNARERTERQRTDDGRIKRERRR